MRQGGFIMGGRQRAGLCLAAAALALPGCATSSSYAGISLKPGAADPELQRLAQQARSGNLQARLDLGIRYEEGDGLPVDYRRAARLYLDAASPKGETLPVVLPATGASRSSVLPLETASRGGLHEAQARFVALMKKMRRSDARPPRSAGTRPFASRAERPDQAEQRRTK